MSERKPFVGARWRELVPRETETDLIAVISQFTTRGLLRGGPQAMRQMAQIFFDHRCIPVTHFGRVYDCNWEVNDEHVANWASEPNGSAMASLCTLYSPEYLGVELPALKDGMDWD